MDEDNIFRGLLEHWVEEAQHRSMGSHWAGDGGTGPSWALMGLYVESPLIQLGLDRRDRLWAGFGLVGATSLHDSSIDLSGDWGHETRTSDGSGQGAGDPPRTEMYSPDGVSDSDAGMTSAPGEEKHYI